MGFFVNNEDLEKLISMPPTKRLQFVSQKMALNVFIDDKKCAVKNVVIDRNGIQAVFMSEHDEGGRELSIEAVFNMPQLKGYSEFLVSVNEPTFSPMIPFCGISGFIL